MLGVALLASSPIPPNPVTCSMQVEAVYCNQDVRSAQSGVFRAHDNGAA